MYTISHEHALPPEEQHLLDTESLPELPDFDVNPMSQVPVNGHKALRCRYERIASACKVHGVEIPYEVSHNWLKVASSIPPVRIGFFGDAGVGKSTIVDRLLGTNVLKSSALCGGAKFVVEFLAHADVDRQDFLFQFCCVSSAQVTDWHLKARADALFWREHPNNDPPSFLKWFLATFTHEEIHYKPSVFAFEDAHTNELPKYQEFLEAYGNVPMFERSCSTTMETVFDHVKPFSPFIQHVSVFGPFHLLRSLHVSLIDIPSRLDGSWLMEERWHLAAKMCKDIYFVIDHRNLTPAMEKRMVELSHHCDNFSICRTRAGNLLGRKPYVSSAEELSRTILSEMRVVESFTGLQSMQSLLLQIGDRLYCMENCEGEDSEYESRYDYLWTHFINALQINYGKRFDTDIHRRVFDSNHLLAIAHKKYNSTEELELRILTESLSAPSLVPLAMSFTPKYSEFSHFIPRNYKTLQCWLTHNSGMWAGDWKNSKMDDLMVAVIDCCYPLFVNAKLVDQQIQQKIDVFLRSMKVRIGAFAALRDDSELMSFVLLRARTRMMHDLLGSFRGFQSFFESKVSVLLRERYGVMLQENLRTTGVDCKEKMQKALRNWFAMEGTNLCEHVLPNALTALMKQYFEIQTEKMRHDLTMCLQQMSIREKVHAHMTEDQIHSAFAPIAISDLASTNTVASRQVDISGLFSLCRGTNFHDLEGLLHDVSKTIKCSHRQDTSRNDIHMSAIGFSDLLFNQKTICDVRVRCGRVEQMHDRASTTFSSWTSKDAGLVEAIVHHCLSKYNLSRTADYYNCPVDTVIKLTGKVVEFVDASC